eukprot:980080-Prorocentrum_minimum.AAC.2
MSALHFAVLSYSGVFGDRGEKSPAVWNGEFKPSKTSKGVMFLGEVQPTHQVGVQMDELPAARTTMMVSFDLLHDEVVEPKPENLLLTVDGEGVFTPIIVSKGSKSEMGKQNYELQYAFNYSRRELDLSIHPTLKKAWGVADFKVTR